MERRRALQALRTLSRWEGQTNNLQQRRDMLAETLLHQNAVERLESQGDGAEAADTGRAKWRRATAKVLTSEEETRAAAAEDRASVASANKSKKYLSPMSDLKGAWSMVASSWLSLLILCCPFGVLSSYLNWGATPTFVLNLIGIIPLALVLGDATEDVALRLGDTVGGLVNATFGNVVEIIMAFFALKNELYTVVSTSLLGSILSNLLLVLGMCFLCGGIKFKEQRFNQLATKTGTSLLVISAIAICVPTAAQHLPALEEKPSSEKDTLTISRIISIILLFMYGLNLYFQLGTHSDLFTSSEKDVEHGEGSEAGTVVEEEPILSLGGAFLLLGAVTAVVALCSELLTGSIEDVSEQWGLSQAFLGIIILPVAGNACEHITAILVSVHNKMDLAMGVAVGSSTQIAIFAIPLVSVLGWIMGRPFSLGTHFDPFAAMVLLLSVIHANFVTIDARSNWLMGVQLIATYIIIGVTYVFR